MKHEYNRIKHERFDPAGVDTTADDLRAARREIDRLDDEVTRLRQTQQTIWDTLTSRVAKLSSLSVVFDRLGALHEAAWEPDDEGDPDRLVWCVECGHPYPCRTAARLRQAIEESR